MQRSTSDGTLNAFVSIHPLDPEDAPTVVSIRNAVRAAKGVRWSIDARTQFDGLMERVPPPGDVTFESGTVGDIPGIWVQPASSRSGDAIAACGSAICVVSSISPQPPILACLVNS